MLVRNDGADERHVITCAALWRELLNSEAASSLEGFGWMSTVSALGHRALGRPYAHDVAGHRRPNRLGTPSRRPSDIPTSDRNQARNPQPTGPTTRRPLGTATHRRPHRRVSSPRRPTSRTPPSTTNSAQHYKNAASSTDDRSRFA